VLAKGKDKEGAEKSLSRNLSSAASRVEGFFVRLVRNAFALFTLAVVVVIFTPLANYMARPLIVDMELSEVDLIVVLGGGAYRNGILSGASNERTLHALRLYKAGLSPRVIFVGASINDTYDKVSETVKGEAEDESGEERRKPDIVEANLMKELSVGLGMDSSDLYVDSESLNTYENLRAVKEFMGEKRLKSCLVVTSSTHMYRAKKVYEKLDMNCTPAPAGDYSRYIKSATGRFSLMREVLWEYAALVLYKSFGYI
jgi:uncharacterized SAM-binding protein YcdF (DUF218 family)